MNKLIEKMLKKKIMKLQAAINKICEADERNSIPRDFDQLDILQADLDKYQVALHEIEDHVVLRQALQQISIAPCLCALLGESAGPGLDSNGDTCTCPGCRARTALTATAQKPESVANTERPISKEDQQRLGRR